LQPHFSFRPRTHVANKLGLDASGWPR
jgi:hypothetical protein